MKTEKAKKKKINRMGNPRTFEVRYFVKRILLNTKRNEIRKANEVMLLEDGGFNLSDCYLFRFGKQCLLNGIKADFTRHPHKLPIPLHFLGSFHAN